MYCKHKRNVIYEIYESCSEEAFKVVGASRPNSKFLRERERGVGGNLDAQLEGKISEHSKSPIFFLCEKR